MKTKYKYSKEAIHTMEYKDKDELLAQYDAQQQRDENIDLKTLLVVVLCMFIAFAILVPNIYIKNKIYYISRDIGKLYEQHTMLKQENRELKRKIEDIQFKNQVFSFE